MHRNKVLTNFLILQNQRQPESENEKKKGQLNISGNPSKLLFFSRRYIYGKPTVPFAF